MHAEPFLRLSFLVPSLAAAVNASQLGASSVIATLTSDFLADPRGAHCTTIGLLTGKRMMHLHLLPALLLLHLLLHNKSILPIYEALILNIIQFWTVGYV
jgi:hypothetical protein